MIDYIIFQKGEVCLVIQLHKGLFLNQRVSKQSSIVGAIKSS